PPGLRPAAHTKGTRGGRRAGHAVRVPHAVAPPDRADDPMSDISATLHAEVVLRAGNRCEYCGLSQLGQEAAFHIDHVVPRAEGGPTVASNLALACVSCSLRKW